MSRKFIIFKYIARSLFFEAGEILSPVYRKAAFT